MKISGNIVTINSRKYDGTIDKSWKADLVGKIGSLITFVGVFAEEINHSHLGLIRRGTISYEFYWLNEWFNIFRFHEPDGTLRNFYCNVNMPPKFANDVLNYVDLDIDILVWKDFTTEILDLNDFEENSLKFKYSPEVKNKACASVKNVLKLIETRAFPFDIKLMKN